MKAMVNQDLHWMKMGLELEGIKKALDLTYFTFTILSKKLLFTSYMITIPISTYFSRSESSYKSDDPKEDISFVPADLQDEYDPNRPTKNNLGLPYTGAQLAGCATKCSKHFMGTLKAVLEGSTTQILKNFDETCK